MKQFIVTKDILNIRNKPSADSDDTFIGSLLKGEVIFLDEKEITGTIPLGATSNIWLGDNLNRVVHSEGVRLLDIEDTQVDETTLPVGFKAYISERFGNVRGIVGDAPDVSDTIDYNFILNIDKGIKHFKGEGVTIGIFDHPIRKDIKLKNEIKRPFNVDHPADSHGTFLAGILAGNNKISGIAQDVSIIELPIYTKDGDLQEDKVIKQIIDFISSLSQPLILNVSQRLPVDSFTALSNIKNAIIVCSAGVDDMLTKQELIFPASLPDAISVGSITENFRSQNEIIKYNQRLDFILPVFDYVSYSINGREFESGTDTSSFSTAIVSGLIALLISSGKISGKASDVRQEILALSQPYNDRSKFNFLNSIIPLK